jgi:hypothetical protein
MNKAWIKSAIVGIIGGGLDAVSADLIDRKGFNFGKGGAPHLLEIGLVGMFIALAAYWKSSPKDEGTK